jgi:hypothetical protein
MMIRPILALVIALWMPSAAAGQNASPAKPDEARHVPTTNVQLQVTIADYVESAPPVKKTVSMVIADGYVGRVRAATNQASATLNVDATPRLLNGRIELRLTLEYRAPWPKPDTPSMPINESITVLLDNGKPLVITQAADPSADRRITVEVVATVLK